MYFNKVTSTVISAMFLLLILSSVNLSSVKLVSAATGDLVNYNNNFDIYTSPSDPNKDSAMQNADCVVNFMQTYVYAASSADSCTNASTSTPTTPTDQAQTPAPTTPTDQAQTPIQNQGYPATTTTTTMTAAPTSPTTTAAPTPIAAAEGPQTGVTDQSDSVGVVRVVDNNTNGATPLPVQSTSTTTSPQNNADDDNDNDDKDAKGKDDDDNNDNEFETKVYNENTVTKEERKLLLTTCFERGYDKGDYLSTKEIVKCAENYNS